MTVGELFSPPSDVCSHWTPEEELMELMTVISPLAQIREYHSTLQIDLLTEAIDNIIMS